MKTSNAIAQQASEMRRVVEQLSVRGTGSQLAGSLRGLGSLKKFGSVQSTDGSLRLPPEARKKGFLAHKSRVGNFEKSVKDFH